MDLVIDERDSNVSSSKSGDDDDQDEDQPSPLPPLTSGLPPHPPTSSSRSSSYNQHSPDGSITPSPYNLTHQTKSVSSSILSPSPLSLSLSRSFAINRLNIIRYCVRCKHLFYINNNSIDSNNLMKLCKQHENRSSLSCA
jgi:hypothetical protein